VKQLLATFSAADPSASVPKLLELRKELVALGGTGAVPSSTKDATAGVPPGKQSDWLLAKAGEVDSLIAACLALQIESSTTSAVVSPGQSLPIKFDAINRSNVPVQLLEVR